MDDIPPEDLPTLSYDSGDDGGWKAEEKGRFPHPQSIFQLVSEITLHSSASLIFRQVGLSRLLDFIATVCTSLLLI